MFYHNNLRHTFILPEGIGWEEDGRSTYQPSEPHNHMYLPGQDSSSDHYHQEMIVLFYIIATQISLYQ